MHIRDDDACSVYFRLDALMPKKCANDGRHTFWKTYSDIQKHINPHCRVDQEEPRYFTISAGAGGG